MFAFICVCILLMFYIEQHYNFNWIPAKSNKINSDKTEKLLKTEEEAAALADYAVSDSVIGQGILPAEDKNYLTSDINKEITQDATHLFDFPSPDNFSQPVLEDSLIQEEQKEILELGEQLAAKDLVDIETLPVRIFLDIKYATTNNFTGKQLYERAKCYLKKPAAEALVKAAEYALEIKDPFYLCLYDCYRPASVQKIMLESAEKPGFLAKVSNHSRGMAVDLGPCDMYGQPFSTPTEFDTFSELSGAYAQAEEISKMAIENRTSLQEIMKKAGFSPISNEWWHFDYKGAKEEEVLDIKF